MALGVTLRQLGLWNVTQPQGRGGEGRVPGPAPLYSGHPAGSHPPAGSGPPGLRCASSPPLPPPPAALPANAVFRAPVSANQMFSILHFLCFQNTHLELGREGE